MEGSIWELFTVKIQYHKAEVKLPCQMAIFMKDNGHKVNSTVKESMNGLTDHVMMEVINMDLSMDLVNTYILPRKYIKANGLKDFNMEGVHCLIIEVMS